MLSIFESLKDYITNNPKIMAGSGFLLSGIIGLLGAIFNWEWIFEYNKIDKWNSRSLINFYWFQEVLGRKASRILVSIGSIILMLCGAIFFYYST